MALSAITAHGIPQQPYCVCCTAPLLVQDEVGLPGWIVRHRGWVAEFPAGHSEVVGNEVRHWLRGEHHNAALRLCDEIVEAYKLHA